MTTPRKLMLAVAILAAGMVSSASASSHGESTYYDTIRPHGHPRSDAVYNANVNACYSSSGESRTAVYDTPAFKQCMLSRGYRSNIQRWSKIRRAPPLDRWPSLTAGRVSPSPLAGATMTKLQTRRPRTMIGPLNKRRARWTRRTRPMLRMPRLRPRTLRRPQASTCR